MHTVRLGTDVKGGEWRVHGAGHTVWVRAQLSHLFLKIQSRWQALEDGTRVLSPLQRLAHLLPEQGQSPLIPR